MIKLKHRRDVKTAWKPTRKTKQEIYDEDNSRVFDTAFWKKLNYVWMRTKRPRLIFLRFGVCPLLPISLLVKHWKMANRTVKEAHTVRGTNPQYLVEKIIRTRIYDSRYWKEYCFGLTGLLAVLVSSIYFQPSWWLTVVLTCVMLVAYMEEMWSRLRFFAWRWSFCNYSQTKRSS